MGSKATLNRNLIGLFVDVYIGFYILVKISKQCTVRRNMAHRYHCVVCTTSTQYYGADRTQHAGLHTLSLHLVTATGSQEPNNPGLEQS